MAMKFRGLKATEVEVRVGSVSEKGATLLFFKDARCDMNILDETLGTENWQREHKEVKGNLFCGVGVWDETKSQWIWKWDCGTESYTEKEKGESSDSFKRACFNLGIGRELYTAPFTFVKCPTKVKDPNATYKQYELENRYYFNGAFVSEIEYVEDETTRKISKVVVCDKGGNAIFKWSMGKAVPKGENKTAEELSQLEKINAGGVDFLENLIADTKTEKASILKYYKVNQLEDMSVDQMLDCVKKLEGKKK